MRFFEIITEGVNDDSIEKLAIVLKNFIGRAASKKSPAKLNWTGLNQISKSSGIELSADYETFKSMYDSSPILQNLVKNFNDDGIELNVPGVADEQPKGDGTQSPQDSQAAVDKIAASAAPQQLAQA
jgi:hypothetical protein